MRKVTRYTPGPWEIDGGQVFKRFDSNDGLRLDVEVEVNSPLTEELPATVRVISAAPDLLKAMEALYDVACHHPKCERGGTHSCSCGVSAALELAREAGSKARGE